jgi:hypothetical protein
LLSRAGVLAAGSGFQRAVQQSQQAVQDALWVRCSLQLPVVRTLGSWP